LKVQEGKYFEKGGAGGIVEASEGGVEDCVLQTMYTILQPKLDFKG
jgi:hypothetical protein